MGKLDRMHSVAAGSSDQDARSAAEIDRDRIIYTSALARLAQVTQVVSPSEGHVFHNRLTHTIEVAQVARRLAQRLAKAHAETVDKHGGLDPDITEACALAHDLGHPPFGHLAEQELDRLVRAHGVEDGFEGNAQSFRIITRLAAHRQKYDGLNLTRATLNGLLKYPWLRADPGTRKKGKFGAYDADQAAFDFARDGSLPFEQSLEASVMDHADAVAYSVHDLVDFYRAGLIPLELFDDPAAFDEEVKIFRVDGTLPENQVDAAFTSIRSLMSLLPLGVRFGGSFRERAHVRTCSSGLISKFLADVSIEEQGGVPRLVVPPNILVQMKFLQNLVWRHVITTPKLATQQWGQRRIVATLFEAYLESIERATDDRNIVPQPFQTVLAQLRSSREGNLAGRRVRLAADIVATLTEDQASFVFRRLTGAANGAITDLY